MGIVERYSVIFRSSKMKTVVIHESLKGGANEVKQGVESMK